MTDSDVLRRLKRLEEEIERLRSLERPEYVGGPGATWTPAFTGTGTAGTFTYGFQVGRYNRIGNAVFLYGRCSISAIGTPPTGNLRLTGLPFTAENTLALYGGLNLHSIANINYTAGAIELGALIVFNTAYVDFYEVFDALPVGALPAAALGAAGEIEFTGMYRV